MLLGMLTIAGCSSIDIDKTDTSQLILEVDSILLVPMDKLETIDKAYTEWVIYSFWLVMTNL